MKIMTRLLLCASLALPLAACQKEEAVEQVEAAPMAAPQSGDREEWRAYLNDAVGRNMDGIYSQPFVYLVPAESVDNFEDEYERLAERAENDLARGIVRGNLLAYAGHNSNRVADLAVRAFEDVPEGTMEGVRVLFIGDAVDNPRVEAAVAPAKVEYVFIEK
ncbi:hypothetical protein WCE55_13500 [Luteimonas sp. MJ293]|uniref:hypothetical protein n=1 Tax=Luteimonas sp. MJ146 TaxID=3129240 RepID=UPI0031BB0402